MKLLMIRHGEPCYSNVKELNLVSYLGELTPSGVAQAETVANDERLQDADIIITSPFTRALQTAAIISRKTQIPLIVEPGLHEILMDLTHVNSLDEMYTDASYKEFVANNGVRSPDTKYSWESIESIVNRSYSAMKKYLHYDKVIVVAHAVVIRTFGYSKQDFSYCEIYEREFDDNSRFENFVALNPN